MPKKNVARQLDQLIESEWYRQAKGVQVDLMAIGKIFDEIRYGLLHEGMSLNDAVQHTLDKYRIEMEIGD